MSKKLLLLLGVSILLLSACSSGAIDDPTSIDNESPTDVVEPTTDSVDIETQTPTDVPTSAPTDGSMDAPVFQQWNAQQVIDAFVANGLEVGDYLIMTEEYYSAALAVAIEGIRFKIPSFCENCGGKILVFENIEDLETTKNYYVDLGNQDAELFSWVFVKGNILVEMDGFLDEELAAKYEAALNTLGS